MRTMRCRIHSFPTANLRHPPYSSASQAGILIAVTPAVHRPLNQPSLSPQTRVKLCQCPAYSVALGLVMQSIALVLIFRTAGPRVHAVLRLKILWKGNCFHRLDIAPDRVFHLHPVSRVLESDPLHAVLILPHNKRCRGGNWTGSSIRIYAGRAWWTLMHALRRSCGSLRSWAHACALSLKLLLWLHLLTWASSKTGRDWMRSVLKGLHRTGLRHEVGVQRPWLLRSWMSTIR